MKSVLQTHISLFSESNSLSKGAILEYSRFTIHTTILVKDKKDIPAYVNIGYQYECDAASLMQCSFYHLSNPVYILPEHSRVHGIACRCDANSRNVIYTLYHYELLDEQILAIADIKTNEVRILRGNDTNELKDIELYKSHSRISNDYAPVYEVQFSSGMNSCVPTKLILNREKANFEAAKALVISELNK